jgi:hypothetical protein
MGHNPERVPETYDGEPFISKRSERNGDHAMDHNLERVPETYEGK